jgi:hypothetical protein
MFAAFLFACVMATHDARIELRNAPATVKLALGRERARAVAVANDPKRHLMLRMEGISVEGEVGVWEVRIGDRVAGTLATYGAEESNGKYIASVVLDEAALRPLRTGAKTLAITFAPTTRAAGTIRIQRLRLVEE